MSESGNLHTNVDALSGLTEIKIGPTLDNGEEMPSGIDIGDNPALISLEGLGNLQGDVRGQIILQNNPLLTSLAGLEGITTVTGVDIVKNGLNNTRRAARANLRRSALIAAATSSIVIY